MTFRVCLDITGSKLQYLDLNQSQDKLLRLFVGFVYAELNASNVMKYNCVRSLWNLLAKICNKMSVATPLLPRLQYNEKSKAVDECVIEYQEQAPCQKRLRYYEGWFVRCKAGESLFVNLSFWELQFGTDLTTRLFDAIEPIIATRHYKTAQGDIAYLNLLTLGITELCTTQEELQLAQRPENINSFFVQMFSLQVLKVRSKNGSMRNFYRSAWPGTLKTAQRFFIDSRIWPNPPYPLFCPQWKSSSTSAETNVREDMNGNAFNSKLVTHIPLSYSDDKAIESILKSVEHDIEHVSSACRRIANTTMTAFHRRKELASRGEVKQYKVNHKIDMSDPANQAATWEHYKWEFPFDSLPRFLCASSAKSFVEEYGLLGSYTLTPFILLLIEQHPAITESWLLNFELYDKHGQAKGFRQSGELWVADSVKRRKGNKKAQQIIRLNDTSKKLFDNIVELTSDARHRMKATLSDDSWRYLLISCASGLSEPKRLKRIRTVATKQQTSPLGRALMSPSDNVDTDAAQSIINNLGCSSMRASSGVRVYLRTRSVKAMSEALGHDSYDPKLLSSYLPEPILNYFQGRWVRVFQNSLIYEAMKESVYLFDAIDIDEQDLAEFLTNHALKPLPLHIIEGQIDDLHVGRDNTSDQSNDSIIPVSVPLLKVINALVDLIDRAPAHQRFTAAACDWYETATFVRWSIEAGVCSSQIMSAMNEAKENPISPDHLQGAVYVA